VSCLPVANSTRHCSGTDYQDSRHYDLRPPFSACYECHCLKCTVVSRSMGSVSSWTEQRCTRWSYQAVVVAKLTYACPAWWGFTTAHDRQKMESVICRGVRFGFCSTNQAPLAELTAAADETLFENILHNQHVLHQ